jgi:hypothetical protein
MATNRTMTEIPARLLSPGYAYLLLRLAMRPRAQDHRRWFIVFEVAEQMPHAARSAHA